MEEVTWTITEGTQGVSISSRENNLNRVWLQKQGCWNKPPWILFNRIIALWPTLENKTYQENIPSSWAVPLNTSVSTPMPISGKEIPSQRENTEALLCDLPERCCFSYTCRGAEGLNFTVATAVEGRAFLTWHPWVTPGRNGRTTHVSNSVSRELVYLVSHCSEVFHEWSKWMKEERESKMKKVGKNQFPKEMIIGNSERKRELRLCSALLGFEFRVWQVLSWHYG